MRCIGSFAMVVFASLAGGQSLSSDRWAPAGKVAGWTAWVDTTTIAKQGAIRYAWTQLRFDSAQKTEGKSYNRTLARAEYNCETGEGKLLEIEYYLGDEAVASSRMDKVK